MIVALMPVRDAGWCLRYTLPALLEWVDAACLLLHCCADETEAIAREAGSRVFLGEVSEPDWPEAEHRQRLLEMGRSIGGTHFATVDSDEVLSANLVPGARGRVLALMPGQVLSAPWINLWRSRGEYAANLDATSAPVAFRDRADLCYRVDGYQLHGRVPPQAGFRRRPCSPDELAGGGLLHLQKLSWRRAVARQARYKALEMARWPEHRGGIDGVNARFDRSLGLNRRVRLVEAPSEWWAHGLDPALIDEDREPWEAIDCARLAREHGPWPGLDLYGVA